MIGWRSYEMDGRERFEDGDCYIMITIELGNWDVLCYMMWCRWTVGL